MNFLKSLITPQKALIFAIIAFAFLFITNGEPFYRSDAWCYYTISKSIIDKNSFVSADRPEYFDYMEHVKETYNGNYISVCSPGTSILQLPGLVIANFFKGDKTIYNDYFMAYNGHTIYEGIASLLTAMFFGLFALILIYKTLRNLKFGEKISILSTTFVFISSYAVWYIFLNSAFTHIYELFAVSAIIYFVVKYQKNLIENFDTARIPFLLGLLTGLSILIRPTLAPLGLLVGLYFVYKKRWKHLLYFLLGGLPILIIWLLYNYISYGAFFASGYSVVRSENFDLTQFNGLNMLFSQYRGWLVYSPIFIFSIAGLVMMFKKNRFLVISSLVSIFSAIVIYGFWPSWWGGGSFGNRFMIFAVPFGAIGLAYILGLVTAETAGKPGSIAKLVPSEAEERKTFIKNTVLTFVLISFFYSLGLVALYRVTITSKLAKPYAGTIDGMYSADRYTPFEIYESNINLIRNSSTLSDYVNLLYKNVNGGSGILAILTGTSNGVLRVDDREPNVEKLIIITPQYIKRPLPEIVEGYYKSNTGKLYSFEITDINNGDTLSFRCDTTCVSLSNKLIIHEPIEAVSTLLTSEYTSIITTNGNFYFKYVDNLQFRGFPENITIGQEAFKL
ncbi:MAG: hypothetical protein ABI721_03175 [Candidatus Dojkabacteria bacterium]